MVRYQRQIILPEIGESGQRKLSEARVLCVGIGGLGSPCVLYLAAAGVGKIGLIDPDHVEISNLQRQVLYTTNQKGLLKTNCAANRLSDLNPDISIETYAMAINPENALSIMTNYDIIVDATDNFASRFLINSAAVKLGKPLVYGAIQGFDGQASIFWAKNGPCYCCLFHEPPKSSIQNCAEAGVIGALAGIVGTTQALETIKFILSEEGSGLTPLIGQLWVIDTRSMHTSIYQIPKNESCSVCSLPSEEILLSQDAYESCIVCNEISLEQAFQMKDVLYIDVREVHEWLKGCIPGARNIPLSELAYKNLSIDPNRPYIVYCQTGGRSKKAAALLGKKGYSQVMSLKDGFQAWRSFHR
jgi:molybdopterin/thiamine biosynthesis adenylyltransferase/rhodanese-related sulfurtransferase